MKRMDGVAFVVVVCIIALAFCARPVKADEWTTADTYREVAAETLLFIDWRQTLDLKNHRADLHETNFVLGRTPSDETVNTYFVSCLILHPIIARVLPADWRHGFQYVAIGVELNSTVKNATLGVHLAF